MDPWVWPLLHAEVVEGQVGVGEVDVVGARVEHGRQDGHDGDHPDQPDYGADSPSLENSKVLKVGQYQNCGKCTLTFSWACPGVFLRTMKSLSMAMALAVSEETTRFTPSTRLQIPTNLFDFISLFRLNLIMFILPGEDACGVAVVPGGQLDQPHHRQRHRQHAHQQVADRLSGTEEDMSTTDTIRCEC